MFRRALLAAALASLVSAAPALGEGKSVSRTKRIKAGDSGFSLKCPRGYAALSGAASKIPQGVELARSAPGKGIRRWRFGFSSLDATKVKAVVRCASTRARYRVSTRTRSRITLGEGDKRRIKLRCAKGLSPSGYGQDQSTRKGHDPGAIDFLAVIPGTRRVTFKLSNGTPDTASVDVFLRCFRRGGRTAHVKRRRFRNRLRADSIARVKHSCRRREFALATGWSLSGSGETVVDSSFPTRKRGGRWVFDNVGGTSQRTRTYLLCLR